jgi:hypothetical protein
MSQMVYKSHFLEMHHEKEHNLMRYVWYRSTNNMTNAEYQKEHLEIVSFSEKYQITRHLIDTRSFAFTIGTDMQEWAGEHFYPPLIASGSLKFSLVVPANLFAQISIEQTIEDGGVDGVIQTRYFDNLEKARTWVLE